MVQRTRTTRVGRGSGRLRARLVLTLLGIAALVVGAFLDWQGAQPGYRLTYRSLLHDDFATTSDATRSVGAISVLIAAVALLSLLDRTGWLARVAGLAGVVLFAMFALQLYRHFGQHFDPAFDAVRAGAWAQAGGALVLLLGGLVRYRPKHGGRVVAESERARAERERERLSADTVVRRPVPETAAAETAPEKVDTETVDLREPEPEKADL